MRFCQVPPSVQSYLQLPQTHACNVKLCLEFISLKRHTDIKRHEKQQLFSPKSSVFLCARARTSKTNRGEYQTFG